MAYRLAVRGVGEEIRLRCAEAKRRLARLIFHSAADHGEDLLVRTGILFSRMCCGSVCDASKVLSVMQHRVVVFYLIIATMLVQHIFRGIGREDTSTNLFTI